MGLSTNISVLFFPLVHPSKTIGWAYFALLLELNKELATGQHVNLFLFYDIKNHLNKNINELFLTYLTMQGWVGYYRTQPLGYHVNHLLKKWKRHFHSRSNYWTTLLFFTQNFKDEHLHFCPTWKDSLSSIKHLLVSMASF